MPDSIVLTEKFDTEKIEMLLKLDLSSIQKKTEEKNKKNNVNL